MISPTFEGTIRELFHSKIQTSYLDVLFVSDVMRPMQMPDLMERPVQELSGGQLKRVAIVLALGKPADVFLLDEPSAYLDAEQRVIVAKVIRRFILHSKKTAFIVEHDFIMATYLADRTIVFSGQPGIQCTAHRPQSVQTGMNRFLQSLNVTFRRDPTNHRPRINKHGSIKDREQKLAGTYFYCEENTDTANTAAGTSNVSI